MAQFAPKQPITTADPFIEVTATPDSPLPIGLNRFQLIVTDNSGNQSQPQLLEVIVRDTQAPTAVIDFANVDGNPQREAVAEFGKSFGLSGKRSSDVAPGQVVSYEWTLLPPDISRPTPVGPAGPVVLGPVVRPTPVVTPSPVVDPTRPT